MVSSPPDAPEPRFAAGCVLSWYQADPGGELAARSEMTAVIDRRDQRGGDDRADARQYGEPAAGGVRAANRDDPCVELFEPAINVVELVQQVGEDLAGELGQFGL
jgi:hypothetical protein